MYHREALDPIVAFMRDLGVSVEYGDGAHGGFLPGVNIHGGVIHVDPDTLVGSGDVLHEAGHIIVVPRRFWPRLESDLLASTQALIDEQNGRNETPDPRLALAVSQGEWIAQAWSYAACLRLGVSPGCVFFPGAYKYHDYEERHPMQAWLEQGAHYGPLHMANTGMTGFSGLFAYMGDNGLPPFPDVTRWTVD